MPNKTKKILVKRPKKILVKKQPKAKPKITFSMTKFSKKK